MGRSMFVIFVIVCYLLCEKLSVINGRRKHVGTVKGLGTLPEQAETLNIKCTGELAVTDLHLYTFR